MDDLSVIPYQYDRNAEVLSLLHKVFDPWIGDQEYFIWKYKMLKVKGCDFPRAWIIEKDGRIVAFNGYAPRLIRSEGRQFWSAQSFDTVTDPECRRQGLFGILQNGVYEEMRRHNIAWVYGWTSDIGYKVFTKMMGWKVWANQRYLMKIIDVKNFAEEKIKDPFLRFACYGVLSAFGKIIKPVSSAKVMIKEEEVFPESANNFYDKICTNFGMIAVRDVPYLCWRFSNPQNLSRLLCAYKNEKYCGHAVLTEREDCIDIDDCLADSPAILSALLARIEDNARKSRKKLIRFRVNEKHPWSYIFKRAGYFWSKTSFSVLGLKLLNKDYLSFPNTTNLHWTLFDRNE